MGLATVYRLALAWFLLASLVTIKWVRAQELALHLVAQNDASFRVDSSEQGQHLRQELARIRQMGFNTIVLNFHATQKGPYNEQIEFRLSPDQITPFQLHLAELIEYAYHLGLKTALRPILLVTGPQGQFPYVDQQGQYWWHGNIRPKYPELWFQNYRRYHEIFFPLVHKHRRAIAWYSLGAELHSMTVGLGERHPQQAFGYPAFWVEWIKQLRAHWPKEVPLTYAANYTDQYISANGQKILGGEIEQWRFFLTAPFKTLAYQTHQQRLRELWQLLDFISIDYYRALGPKKNSYPLILDELLNLLAPTTQSHVTQLDSLLFEIQMQLNEPQPKSFYLQEVGYQKTWASFTRPWEYEDPKYKGPLAPLHQLAAWRTIRQCWTKAGLENYLGLAMWQHPIDYPPLSHGFSPLNNPLMEDLLRNWQKE